MCHFYRADTLVAPLFGGFVFEKSAKTSKNASISLIFQIYFYVVFDFFTTFATVNNQMLKKWAMLIL